MVRAPATSSERIAFWAAWLGGVLLALPILVARYPPMGDLAMHEGTIAIMRHLHDRSWFPAGLYFVVAPQANQLFSIAALALSFALPTDVACKLLVAAIVVATPLLASRLLARLGRSRWLALLIGPIACGWMFRWGLVANLTGFALFLFSMPELERLARRPSAATVVRTTACAAALFFAHESSAVIFAAIAAAFAALHSSTWRPFVARLAPVGATAALVALQWAMSERLLGASMQAIGSEYGAVAIDRLAILPGAVFGGMSSERVAAIGGVWIGAAAASALFGKMGRARRLPLREALWRYRYAVLAAGLVVLYFVFPMSVGGTTLLAHRFLPPACVCLVVACARRATPLPAIVLAAVSPIGMLAVEARDFVAADAEYRSLDRLIALIPRDVAVAQLDLTPRGPSHVAPVPAPAGRVLAERGGRMLFAMTDTPPNPVYVTPGLSWNEPALRTVAAPYAFMPAYDLTRFSYLLARNDSDAQRELVLQAIAPEAERVGEDGRWTLFRSRLQVVDPGAPDRPLPSPPPETLGARIARMRAASAARTGAPSGADTTPGR